MTILAASEGVAVPIFRIAIITVLLFGANATADVWSWEDAKGVKHYVDTTTPIFTWVDESGRVFYSDTPGHVGAVAVQLVWHSSGTLGELSEAANEDPEGLAFPAETPEQREEREAAEEHLCEHARDAFDAYKTAERLYRTNDAGEKEYLSKRQIRATMKDAESSVKKFCN